jgi:o-succinylbenzoate synthase
VKIDRVEVVPYSLPFREPYVTARGRLERRELVLLRVRANGVEGLGEGAPLSLRAGQQAGEIAEDLDRRCRPVLEGAEFDPGDWSQLASACERAGISRGALAAVEMALVDLAAKVSDVPAWRLLGASEARPVSCNATLVAGEPNAVAENAVRHAGDGFTTFKLKVGAGDDIEQVAAVRQALGSDARIRIDANGAWTDEHAIATLRALAPLDIELAEQPVATLERMAALREQTGITIAADESVNTAEDARRAVTLRACEVATVKLAKVGGVRAAFEVARQLPVYLSSALDGPVGIAAAAHVAQALPRSGIAAQLAQGLATAQLFSDTVASRECSVAGGELRLSEGPGFGVEIDERALERYRR